MAAIWQLFSAMVGGTAPDSCYCRVYIKRPTDYVPRLYLNRICSIVCTPCLISSNQASYSGLRMTWKPSCQSERTSCGSCLYIQTRYMSKIVHRLPPCEGRGLCLIPNFLSPPSPMPLLLPLPLHLCTVAACTQQQLVCTWVLPKRRSYRAVGSTGC